MANKYFGGFEDFNSDPFNSSNTKLGVNELYELAQMQGGAVAQAANEIYHPTTGILSTIGSGLKESFKTFIDIISVPSQVVAGILSEKYSVSDAIKNNISPSDVIFGEKSEYQTTMGKIGGFLARTAVDILLDPLTYVTFGASKGILGLSSAPKVSVGKNAAAKLGVDELATKALSEEGETALRYLTQVKNQKEGIRYTGKFGEFVEEAAEDVKRMMKESADSPLNPDFAKAAISNMLEKAPQLTADFLDKGGIKFFGRTILEGQRISSTVRMIPGFTQVDAFTKPTRMALGALFDPTIRKNSVTKQYMRVPMEVVELEQAAKDLLKSYNNSSMKNLADIARANKLTPQETELLRSSAVSRLIPGDPRLANAWRQLVGLNEGDLKYMREAGFPISELKGHVPGILTQTETIGDVVPFKPTRKAGSGAKASGEFQAQYVKFVEQGTNIVDEALPAELSSIAKIDGGAELVNKIKGLGSVQESVFEIGDFFNKKIDELVDSGMSFEDAFASKEIQAIKDFQDNAAKLINKETQMAGKAETLGLTRKFSPEEIAKVKTELDKSLEKYDIKLSSLDSEIKNLLDRADEIFHAKGEAEINKILKDVPIASRDNAKIFLEQFHKTLGNLDTKSLIESRLKTAYKDGVKVADALDGMSEEGLEALAERLKKGEINLGDDIGKFNKAIADAKIEAKKIGKKSGNVDEEIAELAENLKSESLTKRAGIVDAAIDKDALAKAALKFTEAFKENPTGIRGILDAIIGRKQKMTDVFEDIRLATRAAGQKVKKLEGLGEFFEDSSGKVFKRMAATLDELKETGFSGFDANLITSMGARFLDNNAQAVGRRFMQELAKRYGEVAGSQMSGWVKIDSSVISKEAAKVASVLGKEGQDMYFNPMVAKVAQDFLQSSISDDATMDFLKAFDKIQDFWKAGVTSIFPAFHGRNAISNVFLNFLDLGRHTLDPKIWGVSADLLRKNARFENLMTKAAGIGDDAVKASAELAEMSSKTMFTDVTGKSWSFGEIRRVVRDNNIAFSKEIVGSMDTAISRKEELMKLLPGKKTKGEVAKKLLPISQDFWGFQAGKTVGSYIEGHSRLMNFVANLRGTGDVMHAAARTKMFLFDYSNLTKFEKNVMKRIIPFYTFCLPIDESPILTKRGWVHADDIVEEDMALTYSLEKDSYEWQRIDSVNIFDYDNELTSISNSRHELRYTPDHRWVVETSKSISKGKLYGGEVKIKRGFELNTSDNIKVVSEFKDNSNSLLTPKQASLLGWLLTDGYFRWKGNYCEAMIYQSPKKWTYRYAVDAAGTGEPKYFHPDTGVARIPVKLELTKEIEQYLKRSKANDNWVDVVTSLSRESLEAMYDAMYMADGTTTPNRTQDFFACQLDGVAKTFEVLATLLGKRVVRNSRGFCVSGVNNLKISGMETKSVQFTGRVWCPVTKNGTWVTKQGGLITITGNTRKNLELQMQMLTTMPGRIAAEITTVTNIGDVLSGGDLSEEEYSLLPDWMKNGLSIVAEKKGENAQIIAGLGTPVEQPFQAFQPNTILGSVSPLIRLPVELMSGYNFFQGKLMSQVTNAAAFKHAPDSIKELIGYTEFKGKDSEGKPFAQYISLRPKTMHFIQNLPIVSRTLSALKQIENENVSAQYRTLQQITGIRPYDINFEEESEKKMLETQRELEEMLTKARVTGRFIRTFIPKDR